MSDARRESETVGARIKRLREERGMSQRDLADPQNRITNAYISRVEAGYRTPSVRALRTLARGLGVSPHYLEYGVEPKITVTIQDGKVRVRRARGLEDIEVEVEIRDIPAADV